MNKATFLIAKFTSFFTTTGFPIVPIIANNISPTSTLLRLLIFTKTNAGGTDKVWFYDMKADGYSLDDKRNEISDSDISDIIARFNNLEAEADRTRNDQSFFVPKAELVENDYDLSMNKYKKVDRVVVEFEKPEVILARIKSLQSEIDKAITEYESLI